MRMGVLGAGLQGTACALDWLRQPDVSEVKVLDTDPARLDTLKRRFADGRVTTAKVDVASTSELVDALRGCAVVLSAVPYFYNVAVTTAAIAARVPLVDLGGNTDVVFEQRALDAEARAAGIGILPDQGLAPGLAGILAAWGLRDLEPGASVQMRVGGLPQEPRGPLRYALVFSIHGLLNEYAGDAVVLEAGRRLDHPTLTGIEEIDFAAPVGRCEAAYTSGGTSTLPWTFEGKLSSLDYKTVRYPGHWDRMAFLKEIGFLETEVRAMGNALVAPRTALAAVLEPHLTVSEVRDLVVLRVLVTGRRKEHAVRRTYEMIDFFDEKTGLSAMMRTTAFPAAESALLLARGRIEEKGVLAAERVVPGGEYLAALQARGLPIRETEELLLG